MLQQVTRLPFLLAGLLSASVFIVTVFASDELQPQAEPEIPVEEVSTSTGEAIIDSFSTSTTTITSTTTDTSATSSEQVAAEIITSTSTGSVSVDTASYGVADEWYPASSIDCFTNQAEVHFDHPGSCLRFLHRGF
jgi:hypothetical protein